MARVGSFPTPDELNVCFAHVAYQMAARFAARGTGIRHAQAWNRDELLAALPHADVLVVSGLWRNDLLDRAPRLRFVQSIGAGYNQFDLDALRARGIRLASASGVNRVAVSEHAIALMLGLARQLHTGRDHQRRHHWRQMIGDLAAREDELAGKTVGIIGAGSIGGRVARLAKAFEMHVIATRRDAARAVAHVDQLLPTSRLAELLAAADFVVLTCPLTDETRNIIDGAALGRMKPSAFLVNVARGACVDESALLEALGAGRIAGAALDTFVDEPLAGDSPFWDLDNVLITPHTAGETRRYEENVLDILMANLDRLGRGEPALVNQIA
ncbi:MAG TPA: D-2-hydroxyacid dehydrogenase [Candidatus Binatia bacterium]|nr:D-2-hydroxyacid dehydrogenase [Candidatus Binatia bacterium]